MGVIPKKGESIEATEKALEANKAFIIIIIIIDVFGPSSVYTQQATDCIMRYRLSHILYISYRDTIRGLE